jgi:squalene synthase HpnC
MSTTAQQKTSPTVDQAYAYCERMAKGHYENFTVGSLLIPKPQRKHMYAVYGFCRFTDDLGDEVQGDRLAQLDWWQQELERCYAGQPTHPVMVALQNSIRQFNIPKEPFLKLIQANRMDQGIKRFPTYQDLLYYCDHSANPVGRMVLYLFGYSDPECQRLSDATCTALQLANFWQDVANDYHQRGRIYLPLEDMQRFGYTEEMLARGEANDAFRTLMKFEVDCARELFLEGLKLVDLVRGRFRVDLKLFSLGGMKVLESIERNGYDVLRRRPSLSRVQKAWLFASVFLGLQ